MIRIKSKQNNFRRCGMAHPDKAVEYPSDRFTPEQLAVLKDEPMLVVEVIPDEKAESKTGAKEFVAMTGERPDDAEAGIQIGPKDLPEAVESGKQPAKAAKKGKR
jgi:hypothetical protein